MRKATGFLNAAEEIQILDDDGALPDVLGTLYVHAGIAAADVVCCVRLGQHSIGDDHEQAIALLHSAEPDLSGSLRNLLRIKTKAGYSHQPLSNDELKRAERAANRLVDAARMAATSAGD
ncbi:hypothetical protein [Nocardioides dilutus]